MTKGSTQELGQTHKVSHPFAFLVVLSGAWAQFRYGEKMPAHLKLQVSQTTPQIFRNRQVLYNLQLSGLLKASENFSSIFRASSCWTAFFFGPSASTVTVSFLSGTSWSRNCTESCPFHTIWFPGLVVCIQEWKLILLIGAMTACASSWSSLRGLMDILVDEVCVR
jgi:hypothetical protein